MKPPTIRTLTGNPKVSAAVRTAECWSGRLAGSALLIAAGFFVVDVLIEESLYSWRLFGAIAGFVVAVGAAAVWSLAVLLGLALKLSASETAAKSDLSQP